MKCPKRIVGVGGRKQSGKDTVGGMLVQEHGFQRVAFGDRIKQLTRAIFGYDEGRLFGSDAQKNELDPRAVDPAFWDDVHRLTDEHASEILATGQGKATDPVENFHAIVDEYLRPLGAGLNSRKVMQYIGSEWRDRCGYARMWTDWTFAEIDRLAEGGYVYLPGQGAVEAMGTPPRKRFVVTDVRFVHEIGRVHEALSPVWFMDAEQRLGPMPDTEHKSEPRIEVFRPLVDRVLDNNGTLEQLRANVHTALSDLLAP